MLARRPVIEEVLRITGEIRMSGFAMTTHNGYLAIHTGKLVRWQMTNCISEHTGMRHAWKLLWSMEGRTNRWWPRRRKEAGTLCCACRWRTASQQALNQNGSFPGKATITCATIACGIKDAGMCWTQEKEKENKKKKTKKKKKKNEVGQRWRDRACRLSCILACCLACIPAVKRERQPLGLDSTSLST